MKLFVFVIYCKKQGKVNLLYIIIVLYLKPRRQEMSPPNWDDDFDFQDDDAAKKKKVPQKKKTQKNEDDFFDLDDDNTNKLPSIGSKNVISKQIPTNKRSSAKQNPYAENMKLRGNIYDDDNVYEELEESVPKIKSNNNVAKQKQPEQQMDYYQDIADEPRKQVSKKSIIKNQQSDKKLPSKPQKQEEQQQQNYQQEVFDDAYGDDFEEVQQPPKKNQVVNTEPLKKKSILNPQINTEKRNSTQNPTQNPSNQNSNQKKPVIPPKPPSRASQASKAQIPKRNLTVAKPNIPRSQSRHSVNSAQSKRNQSRVISNKFATNISFIPNKYATQIQKGFPDTNLNQLNQQKINKLNEKLRQKIKKFNEELNQMINKNMLHLKAKKNEKQVNVDDKLRVLEQQCKNNDTMIEIMQKQFEKLSGRDGELREQQYQLMTQKRIQQTKQLIKQGQKLIVKLKTQIKSEGNKLTNKNEDKKMAADLHHLKTTLIQSKKDEQKQNQRIQKLDEQILDLGQKITDVDYKLSELIDQAKQKGIQLQSKEQLIKKFEATKKKVQASRNHRSKLQNLLKTKSDIVSHQKQQLRINIKNCQLEIKNLYDSISHVRSQSVKVVEKARTNPKITENVVSHLDSILKSLQFEQPDNFSVRSEDNRSQASNRPLKNSVIGNMEKSEPHKRSESANTDKHNVVSPADDFNKPNLLKKKPKINQFPEDRKNEASERIWREQQQRKEKQAQKQREEQKRKEKQEKQKQAEEEKDKKKPFVFKKNRVGGDSKATQNKPQAEQVKNQGLKLQIQQKKKPEQQKKQQISLAGPKMMKFKRRTEQQKQVSKDISKEQQKPAQKLTIPQNPPAQEQQQEKPIFVPKRFNLRNRTQDKKQQSYMPSIQEKQKQQPKKQVKPEPVIEKKTEEYKPKFNFGEVEDNFKKPAYDPFEKKQQPQQKQKQKIIIPSLQQKKQDDDKPKFNLRLRDRKKNTEQVGGGGYMPTLTQAKPVVQQKPTLNIANKDSTNNIGQPKQNISINNPTAPKQNTNTNNPYAPKQNTNNPYAPKQVVNNPYAPKQNAINLAAKRQQNNSNVNVQKQSVSNPYAPKQEQSVPNNPNNPYIQNPNQADGRKKQGPIKKPKIQPPVQKQKINIYQQAEEAEGLNQFVKQPPKKQQPAFNYNQQMKQTKDLNLNDLLGVNKKKNTDDLADLIGGGGNNKKGKKNADFFGDMDL